MNCYQLIIFAGINGSKQEIHGIELNNKTVPQWKEIIQRIKRGYPPNFVIALEQLRVALVMVGGEHE
jgi:hypothetical protein